VAATRSRAKVRALSGSHSFERVAYTVPEFCFRNGISRPTYHRLRAQGRGPKEMRLGLNKILITADAERDWHELMQGPRPDLESRNAVPPRLRAARTSASDETRSTNERTRPSAVDPMTGS